MKHKHHIIPRHMGGSDDPLNLIELTVEEHSQAHLKLYEQYGKKEDLCAYYMLSGKSQDPEFKKMVCSLGGKALAKKRKESGEKWGFLLMNPDELFAMQSANGKLQGKRNAESGHLKRIAQIPSKKNRGMIWITNGTDNKMIMPDNVIPEGYKRGKTQRDNKGLTFLKKSGIKIENK
jgi:hypothetical protein